MTEQPDTLGLVLELSGKILPYQGMMYPGLTTVYLKASVYRPDGSLLWSGNYEAKRFMTKDPEELTSAERSNFYLKTTEKGLTEYSETLSA